jgi:hypothetical protein
MALLQFLALILGLKIEGDAPTVNMCYDGDPPPPKP